VALGTGGAAETVVDGETGVLVFDPSTAAFAAGLDRARRLTFDDTTLRAHALGFSRERFTSSFQAAVSTATAVPGKPRDAAARGDRP
jgi:glycosyltransferase involved in cell wall biosynthesis